MNIFKRYLASVVVIALGAAQAMAQMVVPAAVTPFGGGGGSVSSGSAISGCTINSIVYINASGNLACASTPVNGSVSTAGRSILTISDTISGSSATSNFLNITGTFPGTLTAATNGALFSTTLDNDAQRQAGVRSTIAGAGGGDINAAFYGESTATGGNAYGVVGQVSGAATQNFGVMGYTAGGTNNIGVMGAIGSPALVSGTSAGGYFTNGSAAQPIAIFADGTTAVVTIADGGATSLTSSLSVGSTISATTNQGVWLATAANYPALEYRSTLTPGSGELILDTTSRGFHVIEAGDESFDFNNGACGTSACTDPGLIIHSAAQDTTQYNHQAAWGQAGGALKTLTESAATSVVRIPVAALEGTGGKLTYRVKAADATDVQIREGEIKFAVVNKAGTETCTLSGASEAADGSVVAASVGTLTYGITCDTTPANAVDIRFNAVSSLTQTTLNIQYFITLTGVGQPARQ